MVRAEMSSLHGFDNIPKFLPSEHGRIIQQFLFPWAGTVQATG
jgi:hypothetical protein